MLKDSKSEEPYVVEEVCETEVVDTEKSVDKADEEILDMEYLLIPKKKKNKKMNAESSRRRSWVWKYFDNLTNIIYRCKLCNVFLSIKGSNTNNMNRHVRSRHPGVFKTEVTKKEAIEVETLDGKNELDDDSEDLLSDDQLAKNRRSWIWSYFKEISETSAQCKLCNRSISHGRNATGNLNRHLKMIHNRTSVNIPVLTMMSDKQMEDSGKTDKLQANVPVMPMVSDKQKGDGSDKMDKLHDGQAHDNEWIIWLYFKRISKKFARCNICSQKVCYSDDAIYYMDEHLRDIHNVTPDYKNWIWQVFECCDGDFFSCKICAFKCSKFDDADKSVQCILDHLKTDHDIISGSQIITGALYEVPNE